MPGNDMHGGFATHIEVPAHGLCPVDEQRLAAVGLSLADVSVLADAVTTPYQSAAQLDIQPGDLAIVVGVGGVGGYAVQIASAMGAKVVAIDVVQDKLESLKDYGADLILNSREIYGRDLKNAVKAFAKENGLRQTEWKRAKNCIWSADFWCQAGGCRFYHGQGGGTPFEPDGISRPGGG